MLHARPRSERAAEQARRAGATDERREPDGRPCMLMSLMLCPEFPIDHNCCVIASYWFTPLSEFKNLLHRSAMIVSLVLRRRVDEPISPVHELFQSLLDYHSVAWD